MQGLAIVGVIVLAAIVYAVCTFVASLTQNDIDMQIVSAWVMGGILFILVVVLWATRECPFFVGGGK